MSGETKRLQLDLKGIQYHLLELQITLYEEQVEMHQSLAAHYRICAQPNRINDGPSLDAINNLLQQQSSLIRKYTKALQQTYESLSNVEHEDTARTPSNDATKVKSEVFSGKIDGTMPYISPAAFETDGSYKLRHRCTVNKRSAEILISTASTYNYVSKKAAEALKLKANKAPPLNITEGLKIYVSTEIVEACLVEFCGNVVCVNFRVLDYEGCDMVLGIEWTKHYKNIESDTSYFFLHENSNMSSLPQYLRNLNFRRNVDS